MTSDNSEWEFSEGDVIEEEHERHAPGGIPKGKTVYRIKRRLVDPSSGKEFYQIEKQEGGTHLYAAGTIEGQFVVVEKDWEDLQR